MTTRQECYEKGVILLNEMCDLNDFPRPTILPLSPHSVEPLCRYYHLNTCAFYRYSMPEIAKLPKMVICIMIDKCAKIGRSIPGQKTDRTPYGVLQHELGHHVDHIRSIPIRKERKDPMFSEIVWNKSRESPLTSYCPGSWGTGQYSSEWFAEMFRLFTTNPLLLKNLRPKTFGVFVENGLKHKGEDSWLTK